MSRAAVRRSAFVASTAAAALLGASAASAQSVTPREAIARLFTAPALQAAWFSPIFLAQVPLTKSTAIVRGIVDTLGAYQSIAPNGAGFMLTFARGSIQAHGDLDGSGALLGLLFNRMQSAPASARIAAIFQSAAVPASWFSDTMLAAVSIDKIDAIVTAMKSQLGAFQTIAPLNDGSYDIAFANGHATAQIFLNADGKIEGLIFRPA